MIYVTPLSSSERGKMYTHKGERTGTLTSDRARRRNVTGKSECGYYT